MQNHSGKRSWEVLTIMISWEDAKRNRGSENKCKARRLTFRATHVENLLSQNCNIFSVSSVFKYIPRAKQIINLSLLNHFYPVISVTSTSLKRKRRIIVYGLVTRYGSQSVASARGFNKLSNLLSKVDGGTENSVKRLI